MRSGASGAGCLDASFAVSAMRARDCRWYSALSMIAPAVNVLRRTRRKPSTISDFGGTGCGSGMLLRRRNVLERVQRRAFVEQSERRQIEAGVDKEIRGGIAHHGHQTDVHDLCR